MPGLVVPVLFEILVQEKFLGWKRLQIVGVFPSLSGHHRIEVVVEVAASLCRHCGDVGLKPCAVVQKTCASAGSGTYRTDIVGVNPDTAGLFVYKPRGFLPAAHVLEREALTHQLNQPLAADFPKHRIHALVPVRIEILSDGGDDHPSDLGSFTKLVDGGVGDTLIESSQFKRGLRIVEQDLLQFEHRFVRDIGGSACVLAVPVGDVLPDKIAAVAFLESFAGTVLCLSSAPVL